MKRKRLNQEAMKERILGLKKNGVAMKDVVACFGRTNAQPPCLATIKKYYMIIDLHIILNTSYELSWSEKWVSAGAG